jgi:deoxyribose-phosphate aldolase
MQDSLGQLISLIDLTRLKENDLPSMVDDLCLKASTPYGHVAAVCVFPEYVSRVKEKLVHTEVKCATVINFPSGDEPLSKIREEIKNVLQQGADEIDVVFPYKAYLSLEKQSALEVMAVCRELSKGKILKIIVESGAFPDEKILTSALRDLLSLNIDFLKTSTGKIEKGASVEAVKCFIQAIQDSQVSCGIKISGGIRTVDQALTYWKLLADAFGEDFISPKTVRFGASSLLDEIINHQKD